MGVIIDIYLGEFFFLSNNDLIAKVFDIKLSER